MRPLMLELFCGTAEVSRAFRKHGWDTWTVDINPRSNADEVCDVMRFEWKGRDMGFAPLHLLQSGSS